MSKSGRPKRYLSTAQIAGYCAVTTDGVLNWIRRGQLRAFTTPGGHYRVLHREFRAFLERHGMPVDEAFFARRQGRRLALIVGAEPQVRIELRRLLAAAAPEVDVEEARDGYDAGLKIGRLGPDLAILELGRLGQGLALCRSIHDNTETAALKILLVAGRNDAESARRARLAGADGCLCKPLRAETLRRELVRLLGQLGDVAASEPSR